MALGVDGWLLTLSGFHTEIFAVTYLSQLGQAFSFRTVECTFAETESPLGIEGCDKQTYDSTCIHMKNENTSFSSSCCVVAFFVWPDFGEEGWSVP